MSIVAIFASATLIVAAIAIVKYRLKIISMFFHHRALARIHERDRTRAKCAEMLDSAHARVAIARLDDETMLDITEFFNCLVDQTMVSSTQLAASFPGIRSVRVRLAEPFDEFSIILSITDKRATLIWREHEDQPWGAWQF